MQSLRTACLLVLPFAATVLATELQAQGKGRDKSRHGVVQQGHPKRTKVRIRRVDDAVIETRAVLREQGYDVVRIEQRRDARVVYYRRGNMGRGRGKGPIMYMILRPSSDRIIVERAPSPLTVQIHVRLGH